MGWDGKIPFDKSTGVFATCPEVYREVEWRDNTPFFDELTFLRFFGRRAVFQSEKHKKVEMSLSDLEGCLHKVLGGTLRGKFKFKKTGSLYTIVYLHLVV